jgi:hypothetical protein
MRFPSLSLFLLAAAGCEKVKPTDPMTADRTELLRQARSLDYDTSAAASGLTHAGGVEVRWSPERGAARIAEADLAHGHIIGVAQTSGGTSPFGTPEGRSYIWVDSTAAGWRTVFIPDDPAGRLTTGPLYFGTRSFSADEPPRFRSVADSFPNGRCINKCCIMLAAMWTPTPELLQRITDGAHAP